MIESIRSHVCDACGARTGSPTGDGLPAGWFSVTVRDQHGAASERVIHLCGSRGCTLAIIADTPRTRALLPFIIEYPPTPGGSSVILADDVRRVIREEGRITRSEVSIKLGRQANDGVVARRLRDLIAAGRIREDKPAGRSAQYVAIGPDVDTASADYPGGTDGGA